MVSPRERPRSPRAEDEAAGAQAPGESMSRGLMSPPVHHVPSAHHRGGGGGADAPWGSPEGTGTGSGSPSNDGAGDARWYEDLALEIDGSRRYLERKGRKFWRAQQLACGQKGAKEWAGVFLPCINWLVGYPVRANLLADVIAGVTVGIMIIPQSISYAMLAGLPVQFGLYSSLVPVFVYSLFGSSRQLAVGPVAIVSLLLSEGLHHAVPGIENVVDPNNVPPAYADAQQRYNVAAVQICLLVGIIEAIMGVIRFGFLTNFLSHSVILGFTHGSAIIIGLSQLKYILGVTPTSKGSQLHKTIAAYIDVIHEFDWRVFLFGASLILLLTVMKYFGKNFARLKWIRPLGPVTVAVVSISITYGAKLQAVIPTVGAIPRGLPAPTFAYWDFQGSIPIDKLIVPAILCAVVGLMESVSIAKALAAKNKYELYANQELRALGFANLLGAGFSSYPATGSFSRSAVCNDTNGKTQLAGFFTGVIVLIALLFVTKPFEYMPKCALAAIVISGVQGLLDFGEAWYLFKLSKMDFLVWATSFLCTLFLGAEFGLGIAIALALLFVIYESAFPNVAVLGRLPDTNVYRNVKQYKQATTVPGVLLARVGAPMYFANCQYVKEKVLQLADRFRGAGSAPLRYIVVDLSPVAHVDATATHMLEDLLKLLDDRGVTLVLSNPSANVMRMLDRGHITEKLGVDHVFVRMHDAVVYCVQMIAQEEGTDPVAAVKRLGAADEAGDFGLAGTDDLVAAAAVVQYPTSGGAKTD